MQRQGVDHCGPLKACGREMGRARDDAPAESAGKAGPPLARSSQFLPSLAWRAGAGAVAGDDERPAVRYGRGRCLRSSAG